ncbi:MAG: hypothetical protein OER88_07835, partial [Planctomycetota bacterium]|nr:hypothetical protein [Planctomycetota bacterium]
RFGELAEAIDGVRLVPYTDRMPEWIAAADVVVSMAGYNTICELACAGARAVVVPRVFPRREQWVRAHALAQRRAIRMIEPEGLEPAALIHVVRERLSDRYPDPGWGLDFRGLERAVDEVAGLMDARRARRSIVVDLGANANLAPAAGAAGSTGYRR